MNINQWREFIHDLYKILKSTLKLLAQEANHWNL